MTYYQVGALHCDSRFTASLSAVSSQTLVPFFSPITAFIGVDTMKKLKAFFLGMREFHSEFSTRCDYELSYDWGREIAHRLTMRRYDQSWPQVPRNGKR